MGKTLHLSVIELKEEFELEVIRKQQEEFEVDIRTNVYTSMYVCSMYVCMHIRRSIKLYVHIQVLLFFRF